MNFFTVYNWVVIWVMAVQALVNAVLIISVGVIIMGRLQRFAYHDDMQALKMRIDSDDKRLVAIENIVKNMINKGATTSNQ